MLLPMLRLGVLTGDDLPAALRLQRQGAHLDWSAEQLRALVADRGASAIVRGAWCGIAQRRLVGYVVLGLHTRSVEIATVVVRKSCRRQGIGGTLLGAAWEQLGGQRSRVIALVPESNVPAQLFFRRQDFLCVNVRRGHYGGDLGEDAYVFHYAGGRRPIELQADLLLESALRS
jgi:ribosomal protein S18 acetylase RimI-like enzyme